MNITGNDVIMLYGDEITPIPAVEMRQRTSCVHRKLNEGCTVIRLTYNRQKQIKDITGYAKTTDGEIYKGDILPTMEAGEYCVPENWFEEVYEMDELDAALDHWTSDKGLIEWYETKSHEFWDNLDGPSLTDFLDEFLRLNPDFSVESDDDFSEEDLY